MFVNITPYIMVARKQQSLGTARHTSSGLLTQFCRLAQKLRAAISKELEHVQKGGPGTNELTRFEKVEKLMEKSVAANIVPLSSARLD